MQIRWVSLKIMQIYQISGNYANQVSILELRLCKLDGCHLKLCKFIRYQVIMQIRQLFKNNVYANQMGVT